MSDFTPHEAPARSAKALPVTVPTKLVGRETALAQVYGQLKQGNPILIYGESGVGKTALAATLANAYTQQSGGVLWLNVDNPRLEELLIQVGRAYTIREITNTDNPVGMIGAVENTLRAQKPLIVIDGRINADTASRFITRCVTGLPVMLVSQNRIDGPWASMELPKLEATQAIALYKQESRSVNPNDDAPVGQIVELLDYSALGIMVASKAMLASKQSPENYVKILQQISDATEKTGASVALTASFKALTGALQGILFIMGATINGKASAELLSMIGGAPVDTIKQAMNIMAQLKLVDAVERHDEPYYQLHSLTHNFIQTLLKGSGRLGQLQEKARDSVLAYAQKYNDGAPASYPKLATEMDTFIATAQWARSNDQADIATELATTVQQAGDFINDSGYVYDSLLLRGLATGPSTPFSAHPDAETAEAIPEPEDLLGKIEFDDDDDYDSEEFDSEEYDFEEDDDEEVAVSPATLDLSKADIPQLRTVLVEAKQTGDIAQQRKALEAIGKKQVSQKMHNEAVATYNEVLALCEDNDDNQGVLETLDMLSALMVKNENSQPAVTIAMRGIQLADELSDSTTKMHILTTLGDAHEQQGESETAIRDYTNALAIARNEGDTQNEAIILYKLGYAQVDGADAETAINTLEQARELFKSQEKREYEGKVLGALGSAYGDQDQWSEAISFHTSALYIAREVGNKAMEAEQLSSLGYSNVQANQLGQAVLRYRQALHIAFESGDKEAIASNIVDMVRLLVESRKHLNLAEMLINASLEVGAHDPDVTALKERISSEKMLAQAYQVQFLPVNGTAQQYAENAYALLDN